MFKLVKYTFMPYVAQINEMYYKEKYALKNFKDVIDVK